MRRVVTSWRVIDAVLKEHANTVFRALRPPATDAAISKLCDASSAKLPRAFLQSLRIHDGSRDSSRGANRLFNHMALLTSSEIVKTYHLQWDLQKECQFAGCQLTRTRKLKNDSRWRELWIPFMDCEGDHLVLDMDPGPTGKLGQVFRWYNFGGRPMRVVAESFSQWLDMLAEELDARRFKLDSSGQVWLKKCLC